MQEYYEGQIKEERLANMLSSEIAESDLKWIIYDDEQTEVMVELSEMIFETLVTEVVEDLEFIKMGSVPGKKPKLSTNTLNFNQFFYNQSRNSLEQLENQEL